MFNDKKKSKKKKKNEIARYFDKKNRKLIKAAPAATARSMKNKNRAMEDVDSQKAQLTMYTTELIEERFFKIKFNLFTLQLSFSS